MVVTRRVAPSERPRKTRAFCFSPRGRYLTGMTLSKGVLSVVAGALSAATALNLPAPYGVLVSSALAACAYLTNHDALLAAFGAKK